MNLKKLFSLLIFLVALHTAFALDVYRPGETIQYSFILTTDKKIPYDNIYWDYNLSYIYIVKIITDAYQNVIYSDYQEITQDLKPGDQINATLTYTIPENLPDGFYIASISLANFRMTYDQASGQWINSTEIIDEEHKVFRVTRAPPVDVEKMRTSIIQNIIAKILSILVSVINWLRDTFGFLEIVR
ncbi:MAG: hypothetical protein DRJ64_05275 [Thermoprotei archaeon]|nr:MAG: hypothetical protein DRJ64_05275 [Thermoprotei archaeon]